MEMRLIEYALEVYRQASFTKAAIQLCIAQPSLSQQIRKLEQELGVTLFYRGHSMVTPTPDGLRFIEQAEEILRMRDDLVREMKERSEGIGRELTIGAPAITGGHVLPPLLRAFGQKYPEVRVRLVEESTERLKELTARGLTDLSILALPVDNQRLATRSMLKEPLYLAIPRSPKEWLKEPTRHLIQGRVSAARDGVPIMADIEIPLSELSYAPFIVLKHGYGFRQTVLELCAESGFQPQIAYETSSVETAQSLVAHGLGVTMIPAMVIQRNEAVSPVYVTVNTHPTRTLVFAYRSGRYLSLAARALIQVYDEMTADGSS